MTAVEPDGAKITCRAKLRVSAPISHEYRQASQRGPARGKAETIAHLAHATAAKASAFHSSSAASALLDSSRSAKLIASAFHAPDTALQHYTLLIRALQLGSTASCTCSPDTCRLPSSTRLAYTLGLCEFSTHRATLRATPSPTPHDALAPAPHHPTQCRHNAA